MKRSQGGKGLSLIECINPKYKKYRVRWDFQPYVDEDGYELISFVEAELKHKPSLEEVKSLILTWKNGEIDKKILEGFVWNGMSVWLSSENQFNYKAAYDLAIQTNGANLPITFKFGSTDEPTYYTFESVEVLSDFYIKAMTYINEQLVIGWQEKDSFDWSEYEKALLLPA